MLKVYLRLPAVADCGVGYYRQWLPLFIAREKKKLDFICHDFTWGKREVVDGHDKEPLEMEQLEGAKWSDILYFARNDVPQYLAQAGGLRDYIWENHKIYKPLVLDIDDNVHATRPYNPGYRSFHPNSPNLVWNIKSMGIFDAITVSTQNLKDFYSKYTDPDKIFVCPNSLDWKDRDKVYDDFEQNEKPYPKAEGEIRIGWTGSAAHWENLKFVEQALFQILKDYPQTTFYYSGLFADLFKNTEVADRIHRIPWAELKEWAKFNRSCDFDIALAPLQDNDFNRAKSNLRILEYGSARFPTIASPVEPYNCFTGKEILFAKEDVDWYDAMETLIKDAELRKQYSNNLYNRCKKDFDMRHNYKIWVDAFKQTLKKKPNA